MCLGVKLVRDRMQGVGVHVSLLSRFLFVWKPSILCVMVKMLRLPDLRFSLQHHKYRFKGHFLKTQGLFSLQHDINGTLCKVGRKIVVADAP